VGADVQRGPTRLIVAFPVGLFEEGTRLRPGTEAVLSELGHRLAATATIGIHVLGFADARPLRPGGAYADNTALSLARAVAVAERLRREGGMPPAALSLGSAGTETPPLAAGDAQSRRTVVLLLTAAPLP
jgi:flagellar motor protein MotB